MNSIEILRPILPEVYAQQLIGGYWSGLEELRLGCGRPLILRYADREEALWPAASGDMVEHTLNRACQYSAYAYSDTIRQGYLCVEGGHRIGICGFGVTEGNEVRTLRDPSSLNIRVAHEIIGCAAPLLQHLDRSTLFLGPPGSGKTTLLRDAVRQLSDLRKLEIGLVDERGELAAAVRGVPNLQIGSRTDFLINVPKEKAVMMLLKTMNPKWIALDEITAPEDLAAMEQAAYCGVKLLATAHGETAEDLKRRPLYKNMMKMGIFPQVVVLHRDKSYDIQEVPF